MPRWIEAVGYDVWLANLATDILHTPRLEVNAQCLGKQIKHVVEDPNTPDGKVNLVAHSMGGVVSRAYIESDDYRGDVSALFTLGSPHAGIPFDFLYALFPQLARACIEYPQVQPIPHPGLCELSEVGMRLFNRNHSPSAEVDYHLVAGDRTPLRWGWLLAPFCGAPIPRVNDGMVCAASAQSLYTTNVQRYRTSETHGESLGLPSYCVPSTDQPYTQAFSGAVCPNLPGCTTQNSQSSTADPAEPQAVPSLTALTEIAQGQIGTGQTASHVLPVDTSDGSLFTLSWLGGSLLLTLSTPGGLTIDPTYALDHPGEVLHTTTPASSGLAGSASYYFTDTIPGLWTLNVHGVDTVAGRAEYATHVAIESRLTFTATTDAEWYEQGAAAQLTAVLEGDVKAATVQALVHRPDGLTDALALSSVGNGTYVASYSVPHTAGYFLARVIAEGITGNDRAFSREAGVTFLASSEAAHLTGDYADYPLDDDGDGVYEGLALTVGVDAVQAADYTLSASLAGSGQVQAGNAMRFTALAEGNQTVTLLFDGASICQAGVDGPYSVTAVHLMDNSSALIPADEAMDAWTTAPYGHRQFCQSQRIYLPVVVKHQ
jgi:hypothetical protein